MTTQTLADISYDNILIDDPKHKAILFEIGGEKFWLPRSLIEVDEDSCCVTMPEWLAIEKDLV
jgi:hypothetical protein